MNWISYHVLNWIHFIQFINLYVFIGEIYTWVIFIYFIGSSTACVVVLNRTDQMLYTANIGDSGFIVMRNGQIVHRSEEQQHYFNTPFQLSLAPANISNLVHSDG